MACILSRDSTLPQIIHFDVFRLVGEGFTVRNKQSTCVNTPCRNCPHVECFTLCLSWPEKECCSDSWTMGRMEKIDYLTGSGTRPTSTDYYWLQSKSHQMSTIFVLKCQNAPFLVVFLGAGNLGLTRLNNLAFLCCITLACGNPCPVLKVCVQPIYACRNLIFSYKTS